MKSKIGDTLTVYGVLLTIASVLVGLGIIFSTFWLGMSVILGGTTLGIIMMGIAEAITLLGNIYEEVSGQKQLKEKEVH